MLTTDELYWINAFPSPDGSSFEAFADMFLSVGFQVPVYTATSSLSAGTPSEPLRAPYVPECKTSQIPRCCSFSPSYCTPTSCLILASNDRWDRNPKQDDCIFGSSGYPSTTSSRVPALSIHLTLAARVRDSIHENSINHCRYGLYHRSLCRSQGLHLLQHRSLTGLSSAVEAG